MQLGLGAIMVFSGTAAFADEALMPMGCLGSDAGFAVPLNNGLEDQLNYSEGCSEGGIFWSVLDCANKASFQVELRNAYQDASVGPLESDIVVLRDEFLASSGDHSFSALQALLQEKGVRSAQPGLLSGCMRHAENAGVANE